MQKVLTILVISLCFVTCKKEETPPIDLCENITCLNGGVCVDGSCDCPGGYSGPNCEIQDLCYGIICLNGGSCINGICDCPEGYTGPDCGTEKTPVAMTITLLTINKYPATTSSGGGWDLGSGPDVYLTINIGTSPNSNDYVSNYFTNATGPITLTQGFPKTLSASSNWTLGVWDNDDLAVDEFMGGYYFKPTEFSNGFPSTVVIGDNTTDIQFTLQVEWDF